MEQEDLQMVWPGHCIQEVVSMAMSYLSWYFTAHTANHRIF
jgi:hypothetical protein